MHDEIVNGEQAEEMDVESDDDPNMNDHFKKIFESMC